MAKKPAAPHPTAAKRVAPGDGAVPLGKPGRSGSKSLMKTRELPGRAAATRPSPAAAPRKPTRPAARLRHETNIDERIAAATEELASGIGQAASAAEQLRRALDQIASAAEESASASHETLAAAVNTTTALVRARAQAEASQRRTEALQTVLGETSSQISNWATNITQNGERQAGSVAVIAELGNQAANIRDIAKAVSAVSDETNLLALNAAIEAARAGDHGKGFAVVADEVRALAETSEKSAGEAQGLTTQIQQQVEAIAATVKAAAEAATAEVAKSQTVILALGELRKDMATLTVGSQDLAANAQQIEGAARDAQKGAEVIAAAAEEQSAAAAEALRSIEQQTAALTESQSATESLSRLAAGAATADASHIESLASGAEQLSAAVQEISSAANQITIAVEQISRGGQQQAAATQEAGAAIAQIEKTARMARDDARGARESVTRMSAMLGEVRTTITELSGGIGRSLQMTRQGLGLMAGLEATSRSIEKIVDGIAMVSIQTNMLAVSGSIEAARAGDFGKGFSVVSNDIRKLARDSADNAGRIKDTVRGIQNQIATVHRELEIVVAAAEIENQKNAIVQASLEAVSKDISAVGSSSAQILTEAEQILAGMQEAAKGAQQIAAAAEEAGTAAAQAAAATRQQARGAEDLAAAIEEIASLAEDIKRRG